MPGTQLGPEDTTVNKTDKMICPRGTHSLSLHQRRSLSYENERCSQVTKIRVLCGMLAGGEGAQDAQLRGVRG